MAFTFKSFSLLLLAILSILLFEDWVSTPTCSSINDSPENHPHQHNNIIIDDDNNNNNNNNNNLKVMMVADLLLSDSGFNRFFRDYYMSKFFRKSFEVLRPDLLLVLGDVSARGSELTRSKWVSVLRRFYRVLGPFVGLPFHAVLGDRDVGECGEIDVDRVSWIANKLPGLDSSGCAAFEIGNVSFVTLNAVALLCGGSGGLRFEVEKVIERESVEVREGTERVVKRVNGFGEFGDADVLSGSGPVVLLHLPLDRKCSEYCGGAERSWTSSMEGLNVVQESRDVIGGGLYKLLHTLPMNVSEYILQALKPSQSINEAYFPWFGRVMYVSEDVVNHYAVEFRIIFSAHRYTFSDHVHRDRTREISVPAMSWNARDDPGFVIASFQKTGRAVSISYCSLARESHIVLVYIFVMFLFCLMCLKG